MTTYDILAVHHTYHLCDSAGCGETIEVITDGHRYWASDGTTDADTAAERDGTRIHITCPRPETHRRPECGGTVTVDLTTPDWRPATDADRRLLGPIPAASIVRID